MNVSPILSIERGTPSAGLQQTHSHPEPVLLWSATATVLGTAGARDWLIPPGYGLWVPGGVEHGGTVLHHGEMSVIHLDAAHCPITWPAPTGVAVGPLLRELIRHLYRTAPHDPTRTPSEALLFTLLTPLATHDIPITVPADPRARAIAERLLADPADQRELADWADHVHSSVRTLSRLFPTETGLTFAAWRTHARIRAAVPLLATGTPVNATARAVGYRRPSAFITAFRRITGQTPGIYLAAGSGAIS
ncbi:helix-turn-helix domain-containing protein [Winogradskya humida]|uniref:AraC family transcriptional regulator n=1 Tax=Winogradskya humida TaxID=113566 RepID=A0ABQ4A516_9ACTN|nr:AraC family transcriptional regulator [Actinoplanes humidus]GIE25824.1 AraC family transcriptional regulator [Actinoplanes humidus]